MFYPEKSIRSHLTCKVCNCVFRDPRMLPCGHSFCNECINDGSNKYMCQRCQVSHDRSAAGFPVNIDLAELAAEQPKQVTQSNKVKELRSLLERVLDDHASLSSRVKMGADEIREQFQSVRNSVDAETELRIEEIRQLNTQMRQQIDQYEIEALNKFDQAAESQLESEIEPVLSNALEFYSNTNEFLNQNEIDEEQVVRLIQESKEHANLLAQKTYLIRRTKFNDRFIKFLPYEYALDRSDTIGSLYFDRFYASSLKQLNFAATNFKTNLIDMIYLATYRLIYLVYQDNFSLLIECRSLDENKLKNSVSIKLATKDDSDQCKYQLLKVQDRILFAIISHSVSKFNVYIYHDNECQMLDSPELILFDESLRLVKSTCMIPGCQLMASNWSSVFFFHKHKVMECNSKFVYSIDFSQNVPQSCKAMQANQDKLFILFEETSQMNIRVFGLASRNMLRELELDSLDFTQLVVSRGIMTVFDNKNNQLKFFDIEEDFTEREYKQGLEIPREMILNKSDSAVVTFFNNNGNVISFEAFT